MITSYRVSAVDSTGHILKSVVCEKEKDIQKTINSMREEGKKGNLNIWDFEIIQQYDAETRMAMRGRTC